MGVPKIDFAFEKCFKKLISTSGYKRKQRNCTCGGKYMYMDSKKTQQTITMNLKVINNSM